MWNTCSIGRRWKPCEGWSRPVLTGERGTLSNPWWVGSRPVVVFSLDGREHCFLVVTRMMLVRRFASRPLSGSRTATIGIVAGSVCRPIPWWVGRCIGFAVVMAQVRRPVPFRTRKLRPGRGDGTALERVWESSTPPHSFVGGSRRASAPGTPFFVLSCLLCRPAGRSPLFSRGSGRLFPFPVGSVCFGLPKRIFVIPQRLLVNRYFFRNVLLTRYMIRFVKRNR